MQLAKSVFWTLLVMFLLVFGASKFKENAGDEVTQCLNDDQMRARGLDPMKVRLAVLQKNLENEATLENAKAVANLPCMDIKTQRSSEDVSTARYWGTVWILLGLAIPVWRYHRRG